MLHRNRAFAIAAGLVIAAVAAAASAQQTQYVPLLSYRVGPYAAGGSGIFGGYIDYWTTST